MTSSTTIAVIPARGGSRRVPRKNIRPFAGQPMLARAIRTAVASGCFARIVISSDDAEILALAQAEGAEVITRPAKLADDFTSTRAVICHAIESLDLAKGVLVCCLYPATPLLPSAVLRQAVAQAEKTTDNATVYAVRPFAHAPARALYRDDNGLMVWQDICHAEQRTQDFPESYHDAGQFYILSAQGWLERTDLLHHGHGITLGADQAVDIDTEDDWRLAEIVFAARQKSDQASNGTVLFRADASHRIGSGHVMRCLTLAHWLKRFGYRSHFLCRDLPGQMSALIGHRGHAVTLLAPEIDNEGDDANASQRLMFAQPFEWVVVDHYGLGLVWEQQVPPASRVMIIDDLAHRPHRADIVLNQNLGSTPADYQKLVSGDTKRLCGSEFALLRPDFASWRERSLRRQALSAGNRLLINFGGMDEHGYTASVMSLIAEHAPAIEVSVLVGGNSPHANTVQQLGQTLGMTVHAGIGNVAQLLSEQDWVIGAAGSSLWERCCLGVPSLLLVQADNQIAVADAADKAGIGKKLADMRESHWSSALQKALPILPDQTARLRMSLQAAAACDGRGVARVLSQMIGK